MTSPASPLQTAYHKLLQLHHDTLLNHGGQVALGVALAVKEIAGMMPDDQRTPALIQWAEQAAPAPAGCSGSGKTVSRWNQTADRSQDRPYMPGDQDTCPVCGKPVDVTPQAAQLRETGYQAVGRLAAH